MRVDILAAAEVAEMGDPRDPAIKIFGRTIPLPEEGEEGGIPPSVMDAAGEDMDTFKEIADVEVKHQAEEAALEELDQGHPESSSGLNSENEQGIQAFMQDDKVTNAKHDDDHTEAEASGQEKILKKPDKVLPCPRCNSMDTKFCYYNNYNVNQPRHFCKNCQRYWTAGGTMRNVPVGAGRRKNKHSSSHHRPMMILSDGMTTTRPDAPDPTHNPSLPGGLAAPIGPLKVNGTVLKFGPEAPLSESMASVLNLCEQKIRNKSSSVACPQNLEGPSCASSVMASNCVGSETTETAVPMEPNGMQCHFDGVTPIHPMHCFPGPPWAYPWNPGWNNAAAMAAGHCTSELVHGSGNGNPSAVQWNSPQLIAGPAFCPPAIPFPFIPAYFWGCMSGWPGGTWNVPWAGSSGGGPSPSSSTSNSGCSANGSPALGKHSRDTNFQGEEKTEKSLWVPKTLRIDDPDEAAKSSIWATLGIKPDEGLMYKAFRSKSDSKGQAADAAHVLHANPAALSRSRSFQESS